MSKVFISHSSKDKTIARQLASDLGEYGHSVFFDEWDIKAGQCIITEIDRGLSESDHVVILLSPHSVDSTWVDREWKAKYWSEVENGRVGVIPVLIADCNIPPLLKSRKYADFRQSYLRGLRELNEGLGGGVPVSLPAPPSPLSIAPSTDVSNRSDDALTLVASLNDREVALSRILPRIIRYAQQTRNTELEDVSRKFLVGYEFNFPGRTYDQLPEYAKASLIDIYVCLNGEINTSYIGWGGSTDNIMMHIENDTGFHHRRLAVSWPIVDLEERAATFRPSTLGVYKVPASMLSDKLADQTRTFHAYFRSNSWSKVLMSMRKVLIEQLGR